MKGQKSAQNTPKKAALRASIAEWLRLGQLRTEKCDLKEAQIAYLAALRLSKKAGDLRGTMEALSGLLRLAGEALDSEAIQRWEEQLDEWMARHPGQVPATAWYCKGVVADHQGKLAIAQRHVHRSLRVARSNPSAAGYGEVLSREDTIARSWVALAHILRRRKRINRAYHLAKLLLKHYEPQKLRSINGILYVLMGTFSEKRGQYDAALEWYQKAHASFLEEHNWYHHLYVLYGYARIARYVKKYSQSYWYLDLIEKACSSPEFGLLRREIANERSRLEQDAVDLLVDSRHSLVKTRERGRISFRKQYVLLHILEELSAAHSRKGDDRERGLTKAEIIERVWQEPYRPEVHDNKLYYNINRLRKLIEPDVRNPQYLLNCREGYRLAPGLRVHLVGKVSVDRKVGSEISTEEGRGK